MLSKVRWTFLGLVIILTACNTSSTPENPSVPAADEEAIETEADSEGVSILRDDQPEEELPLEEQARLRIGEGVKVGENGRATLRLTGLLTADLFRGGEIVLEELSAEPEAAAITIRQKGGMLLADFNPARESERRLTIETDFATLSTGGARLMVVREAGTPLEWIVNLGLADQGSTGRPSDEVQVTAGGVTQTLRRGTARWVAPAHPPGQNISIESRRIEAWLNTVKSGEARLALGEVLLAPANTIGQADALASLPRPGRPFELEANEQGAVQLNLDPTGLFGNPGYNLEDCNGDGRPDIVIEAGRLNFDFRPMLARALALDVTIVNLDEAGSGALWVLDPGGDEIDREILDVGPNQSQTLSLRSGQPFHTAALAMSNGCFLGFSLTPPSEAGEPAAPRAAAATPPGDAVVNVLASPEPPASGENQIEALPIGEDDAIQIDGEPDDWEALSPQNGPAWISFDAVTYDNACATRYPEAAEAVDLAARVRFAYDEESLYVAFRVDDDGYVGYTGANETYFLGDAPQLSLDMELLADFGDGNRSADDWQVDFQPDPDSPRVALWQLGGLTSRPFTEAGVAVTSTATGYFLEAALPWAGFNAAPQPGDRLGLAANVNDNDTPGANAQECIISTAPEREWNVPTTWGTLLLRPAG